MCALVFLNRHFKWQRRLGSAAASAGQTWRAAKVLTPVPSVYFFPREKNESTRVKFRFSSRENFGQPVKKFLKPPVKNKFFPWEKKKNYTIEKIFPSVKTYRKITPLKNYFNPWKIIAKLDDLKTNLCPTLLPSPPAFLENIINKNGQFQWFFFVESPL